MVSEAVSLTWSGMRSFDDLLLETIGDVLKQVFGEESAKIILQHVEKTDCLKWEEIPKSAEIFADALRKVLGAGSVPVENLILKSLYSKLELKFEENEGYGFSDYIKRLRSKWGLRGRVKDGETAACVDRSSTSRRTCLRRKVNEAGEQVGGLRDK